MAGHSHAKNVKLRKAAVDAKRSKLFSKLARLVITAARGGGDPERNSKLAFAISKAKSYSLPRDTIEKAIKKGSGETGGEQFENIVYEGYGPGGVAVICDILTDNRNRTAGEIRKIFDVRGGKLGTTNCVAYMFQRKGQFILDAAGRTEDEVMELAMDAGADDVKQEEDSFVILCDPSAFNAVQAKLAEKNVTPLEADLVQVADTLVKVDDETARRVVKLVDDLDDHDDVQSVFSNADLPDSAFE
jgi:YebC/PmpR family DNA-binding regulatory protein